MFLGCRQVKDMFSGFGIVRDGVISGLHIFVVLQSQSTFSTVWLIPTQLTMGIDSFQEAIHAALPGDLREAVL